MQLIIGILGVILVVGLISSLWPLFLILLLAVIVFLLYKKHYYKSEDFAKIKTAPAPTKNEYSIFTATIEIRW